jgi:hypothetical protein
LPVADAFVDVLIWVSIETPFTATADGMHLFIAVTSVQI